MSEYGLIPTTYEVWVAIRKAHPGLRVYSCATYDGYVQTAYGFAECSWPLMEAEATWQVGQERTRETVTHRYWLCVPKEDGQ